MLETVAQNQWDIFFITAFGLMALGLLLESFFPRRPVKSKQEFRWINNIGLAILNHYIAIGMSILLVNTAFHQFFQPDHSLFHQYTVHPVIAIFIVIFASELLSYWGHRAFHYFPILWRFHSIHHNDIEVDATTSHRHHPVEPLVFSMLHSILFLWLGAPILALIIYNFIRITIIVFAHSNLKIPVSIDRWLRRFILTPDFHRLHHAADKNYTDSNFGVTVPWFDYLFKTAKFMPVNQQLDLKLGLEKWRTLKDSRIDNLLFQPFRKQ